MIEGKGLGGKKINRVGVSMSNHYDKKLRMLARSCDMAHTTLAGMILERCLDDPQFVYKLQNEFNKYRAYRVTVICRPQSEWVDFILYNKNERDDF